MNEKNVKENCSKLGLKYTRWYNDCEEQERKDIDHDQQVKELEDILHTLKP